jgi:MFS transporter, DHA1 family, tetracycline resistance protein
LSQDLDPSSNADNLLAYAKVKVKHPLDTSRSWNVRVGKSYEAALNVVISQSAPEINSDSRDQASEVSHSQTEEFLGVPKRLLPLYAAFLLDSIAVGMAMPLLPFFIMELGAKALQLSFVISSNYIVQMIGCLVMGMISDRIGRRFVLLACLAASSLSYFGVSTSHSLVGVTLARIIVGSCGGLVPVMQTCVADIAPPKERPKYLGRVTATFGLGFVLGPAISALLPQMTIRQKIQLSALLPLIGFIIAFIFFKETKFGLDTIDVMSTESSSTPHRRRRSNPNMDKKSSPGVVALPIVLLVMNGFLIMYAFATETIYAMFLKDSFGYGERALSAIFAVNGLFIGIFQVFLIKPMVNTFGKHLTLVAGNLLLALGMIGFALVRKQTMHFLLFTAHIVGYSIADTALASLISRYSNPSSQGRDLALNQAAQSCARVLSPLFAGILYERSKSSAHLPVGALPFLAGALCPAFGIVIPTLLYLRSKSRLRKKNSKDNLL